MLDAVDANADGHSISEAVGDANSNAEADARDALHPANVNRCLDLQIWRRHVFRREPEVTIPEMVEEGPEDTMGSPAIEDAMVDMIE